MMRSISTILTVFVLFTQLRPIGVAALLPKQAASPCGEPSKIYLPIVHAMAQTSIIENLEQIMRADAAFPYDAVITQVFTNTVNVKPVGSRTIIRDVALPEHIKADDLEVGYPVRLGNSGSKITVLAYFEQFADPESVNYAGVGMKMPGKPTVSVKATAGGWVITWPVVPNATRYLVYTNNTPDGDAPELLATLPSSTLSYTATYNAIEEPFRYFAVQACNGLLEGDVSNWVTDETPPLDPAWASHTFQADGHHLKWTHPAPADVEEYLVFRNTSASDAGALEIGRTGKLELIAPYTSEGDYFGVQAVDYSGLNKSATVWTSQAYDPTPATAGNVVAQMAQIGGFILSWAASPNTLRYEVEGATDSSGSGAAPKWTGQALTTPILIETGVTYFRVRAQGYDLSYSAWSDWMTDTTAPPKPVLAITADIKSVSLNFASSDPSHNSVGISYYVIERADGAAGQNAAVINSNAPYFSFPQIIPQTTGVTRYFRVTPYDFAGNAGTPSDWTAGTPSSEGATVQDKFDGYGGSSLTPLQSLSWLKVDDFEDTTPWNIWYATKTSETSLIKEGSKALRGSMIWIGNAYVQSFYRDFSPVLDLSQDGRFTDEDYIIMQFYISADAYGLDVYFETSGSDHFAVSPFGVGAGWNTLIKKKKDVNVLGNPTWASINRILIQGRSTDPNAYVIVDDLRIVKAHPDLALSSYSASDTGRAWDIATQKDLGYMDWHPYIGQWHIYPGNRPGEPNKPFSYGQIMTEAPIYSGIDDDRWLMSHKPLATTNIVNGTVQVGVFHKANSKSGVSFFVKNVTPDHWTMYAVEADNVADTITLVKWMDGTRTVLGSGTVTSFYSSVGGATANIVWIGADFSEYDSDGGRIKVYASTVEGNLIQAGNLKISVQDTEIGSGGGVGLLSYRNNVRFVNFTAGSPAHAEVADVAKALDGPIVAGEVRRVHYNRSNNRFEYTDDGHIMNIVDAGNATQLGGVAAANFLQRVSANRPGVYKLYRNDDDSAYNVQTLWDGSRWLLRGYNGDTYHAPARVDYADNAGNAGTLDGYDSTQLKAYGSVLYRNANLSLTAGNWTVITWTNYLYNTGSYWNGATRLTAARTGWHTAWLMANVDSNGGSASALGARLLRNGGTIEAQHNERFNTSAVNSFITLSITTYMTTGDYYEAYVLISGVNGLLNCSTAYAQMGLISLEA